MDHASVAGLNFHWAGLRPAMASSNILRVACNWLMA
jgi:hypothetical protein